MYLALLPFLISEQDWICIKMMWNLYRFQTLQVLNTRPKVQCMIKMIFKKNIVLTFLNC